jgi:hypothetical protein
MMRVSSGAMSAVSVALTLLFVACGSGDKERIGAQNDAASTRGATSGDGTSRAGGESRDEGGAVRISVFDLRAGDCIAERGEDALLGDIDEVRVAPCNHADVTGAVTDLVLVEDPVNPDSPFPGESYLDELADERCNRGAPFTYLIPLEESWSNGDRTIVCINDYTAIYVLGGCLDESDYAIACEHEDAVRVVTALVDVSDELGEAAAYPGVDYFDEVFEEDCRSDDDYYLYPTDRSWALGDREVVCTRPHE